MCAALAACGDNTPDGIPKTEAAEVFAAQLCEFNKRCMPDRYASQYGADDSACVAALSGAICGSVSCVGETSDELLVECSVALANQQCAGNIDQAWPSACHALWR